ncbi:hypothetical protein NPX13_g8387 [Xylaria arbuscula]|uniref:SET domain-containing protein n=1 Tax=Xylaria arbuscula TaxID=114810 RepID=A0A9W8N920_9PEZI|nr:hypothetical protein NPX13_g8387 [Xylaria arbuscula]
MGADAGFDMVPRLSQRAEDLVKWEEFLKVVKEYYVGDEQVEVGARTIHSKITSGSAADTGVEKYIEEVTAMAKALFDDRIRRWNELLNVYGFYRWDFVNASIKSYDMDIPTPELIPNHTASNQGTDCTVDLYEVMTIPGRGKGLIAKVDILKGTRIICEKPLFTLGDSTAASMNRLVAEKLKLLSKDKQREFLSLHNNFPGKYAFAGIFKTNAIPCGHGSSMGGVYTTACLINHSCIPNANNCWNEAAQHETIHATRDILVGEEILISYAANELSQARQRRLRESFGFQCSCELCSQPAHVIQASDKRRADIERLDAAIGNPFVMATSPQRSLAACHELLQVLDREYGGVVIALLARLYYDAFQISIAHGDQARAIVFAERSYRSRVECEGEDSPDAQQMKGFMLNPTRHLSFNGCLTRWRSSKTAKPKSLDADSFDKWLWRLSG